MIRVTVERAGGDDTDGRSSARRPQPARTGAAGDSQSQDRVVQVIDAQRLPQRLKEIIHFPRQRQPQERGSPLEPRQVSLRTEQPAGGGPQCFEQSVPEQEPAVEHALELDPLDVGGGRVRTLRRGADRSVGGDRRPPRWCGR